jgi:gas vesicle protein
MGQGPEELRTDIERRRDELGATIDAIGDRVSPGRIMERRRNRMVEGWRTVTGRVMGTISSGTDRVGEAAGSLKDHVSGDAIRDQTTGAPLSAGMVAFGIGFLVAAVMPATDPEKQVASRAHDALEPAKEALAESGRNLAEVVKEDAKEAVGEVKSAASDAANEVADTAKHEVHGAKEDATGLGR